MWCRRIWLILVFGVWFCFRVCIWIVTLWLIVLDRLCIGCRYVIIIGVLFVMSVVGDIR